MGTGRTFAGGAPGTLAEKGVLGEVLQELTKLPGIGPKSAERIAFYLLAGDRSRAKALVEVLQRAIERLRPCRECFYLMKNCAPSARTPSGMAACCAWWRRRAMSA